MSASIAGRRKTGALSALVVGALVLQAVPVQASGDYGTAPWFIDSAGGGAVDQDRFFDGQPGVILTSAPRSRLFMAWRLLHDKSVGREAGETLAVPCCDADGMAQLQAIQDWTKARLKIAGATAQAGWMRTDREVPNQDARPNCFTDAFKSATATLEDRVARFGAASPAVKLWLVNQDRVFLACSGKAQSLEPAPLDGPAWLMDDVAYQNAALSLYRGLNLDAAKQFAAITANRHSSWRSRGLYLTGRALLREALQTPDKGMAAAARKVIDTLASMPEGTFGRDQADSMRSTLDFAYRPAVLKASIDARLEAPRLGPHAAADFRDFVSLADKGGDRPEMLDWIDTLRTERSAGSAARLKALDHAWFLWDSTNDRAWLIAALSLADADDKATPELLLSAGKIRWTEPAYLSVAYHQFRLSLASPPAQLRHSLDAVLARPDLSVSDRNLFTAERLQVASSLHDLARLSLRKRLCAPGSGEACPRWKWTYEGEDWGIYDGPGETGTVALGVDAKIMIDRLPLAQRIVLSEDGALPKALQMDLALTAFTRAVLLQDDRAVDRLCLRLETLLPALKPEWARIASTAPGPDKRFAEAFLMAKVPGLSPDFNHYTRPSGTVRQFQGQWREWLILRRGLDQTEPEPQSYGLSGPSEDAGADSAEDVACLDRCGAGAFPLLTPAFAAVGIAARERSFFHVSNEDPFRDKKQVVQDSLLQKAGAESLWEQAFAWALAHPRDPRAPEAVYWLSHIARYGESHGRLSHRTFVALHTRWPTTAWARKTRYFYD